MTSHSDAVVLIGPMGAGKTSIGRRVAKTLGRPFFDTDIAIVLAESVLEKFGGDSVRETRRNLEGYLAAIPEALRTTPASEAALLAHELS